MTDKGWDLIEAVETLLRLGILKTEEIEQLIAADTWRLHKQAEADKWNAEFESRYEEVLNKVDARLAAEAETIAQFDPE